MDKSKIVDCLNRQKNLRHVEPGNVRGKGLVLDEHRHKVASRKELHEHVQECFVLERVVQLHYPGAVRLGQDVSLCAYVRELLLLEHFCLHETFQGKDLCIRLPLYEPNFSECSLTNDFDGLILPC